MKVKDDLLTRVFFSIVIPFFNREKFLEKAVQSVIDQTYKEWELILVNDGSTDDSLIIAKSFDDSRIKVVSYSLNQGNAFARNSGWKASKYSWVAYLDSDDWYEKDYLEKLALEIRNNPEIGFFWTGVRFIDSLGNSIKEEFWKPKESLPSDTFFDELRIGTNCGIAVKRTLLESFGGFDENFKASVDREFFLRISQNEMGKGIPEILVNCLIGEHVSVRKNYSAQAAAYNELIKRYEKAIKRNKSRTAWWYHKAMWLNLYCNNTALAWNYLKTMKFPQKSIFLFLGFVFLPKSIAITIHRKLARK